MTTHSLGDQPIEPDLHDMMNALASGIDALLNGQDKDRPKKNGFCLMVFPFDDFEGRANYISNARREDVIVLLKEQLARFEGQPEMKGKA
jgi:hypothetical protein